MDIYRFFHPHHNPRLLRTALRQQELGELEQAASEILKALERALQRCSRNPSPPIMPEHFKDLLKAMRFVRHSLQTLCDAHPGDSREDMVCMMNERSEFIGWENWASLVREQLIGNPWCEDEQERGRKAFNECDAKAANAHVSRSPSPVISNTFERKSTGLRKTGS